MGPAVHPRAGAVMLDRSPDVWGPSMWLAMHLIAAYYPDQPSAAERRAALHFYSSLQHLLPCMACRAHYADMIAQSPPRVGSGAELFEWTRRVHNNVNARTGKQQLSSREAMEATLNGLRPDARRRGGDMRAWMAAGLLVALLAGIALFNVRSASTSPRLEGPCAANPSRKDDDCRAPPIAR